MSREENTGTHEKEDQLQKEQTDGYGRGRDRKGLSGRLWAMKKQKRVKWTVMGDEETEKG